MIKIKQDHNGLKKLSWFFVVVLLTLTCEKNSFLPSTEPISKILESPSKYHNKIEIVKGMVTESILALGVGYFIVSDRNATIPIIPLKTFPKVGEEVKIKRTVRNAFVIGEKSLTVTV